MSFFLDKYKHFHKKTIKGYSKQSFLTLKVLKNKTFFAVKSLENGYISVNQLESICNALLIFYENKLFVHIFSIPDIPFRRKGKNRLMGRGLGEFEKYVFRLKKGSIILEFFGDERNFNLIYHLKVIFKKFPVKVQIVARPFRYYRYNWKYIFGKS